MTRGCVENGRKKIVAATGLGKHDLIGLTRLVGDRSEVRRPGGLRGPPRRRKANQGDRIVRNPEDRPPKSENNGGYQEK